MSTATPATTRTTGPTITSPGGRAGRDLPLSHTQAVHLSALARAALSAGDRYIVAFAQHGPDADDVAGLLEAADHAHEAFLKAVYGLPELSGGTAQRLSDLVLAAMSASNRHLAGAYKYRTGSQRLDRLRTTAAGTYEAFLGAVFALIGDQPTGQGRR